MAIQLQLRRGTATQHQTFTGASGEVTLNTTNWTIHLHDGSYAGGYELARADLTNIISIANAKLTNSSVTIGSTNIALGATSTTLAGLTSVASVAYTGGAISLTGNASFGGTLGVTGNTTLTGTLAVTGAVTMASTLGVTGNFSVATNKFNVTASNGNVSFPGNLTINTNKFQVLATSGNTTIGGTLSVTGASSLSSLTLSTPLGIEQGGLGQNSLPQVGQIPIGNAGNGFSLSRITAGPYIEVVSTSGAIQIGYTGTVGSSAVFAPQAVSDLGFVYDANILITEDLGQVTQAAALTYDMGVLRLDGVVSLSNLDQSVKSDYLGYAIIFGF